MTYYMAYGSNLNKEQMKYRCPDAEPVTTGILHDWALAFRRGFLTIERSKGSYVPVGIWRVSFKDIINLDRYEGYPTFYRKAALKVNCADGLERDCLVYIMTDGYPIQVPTDRYFYTVRLGYNDFGLDKAPLDKAYEAAKWPDD